MAVTISRGTSDSSVEQIVQALRPYEAANPRSQIAMYRQNPVSVRIRIVDPSFRKMDKAERHEKAWQYLKDLPEDVQGDISMLLSAPQEIKASFANLEFDDPIPSGL